DPLLMRSDHGLERAGWGVLDAGAILAVLKPAIHFARGVWRKVSGWESESGVRLSREDAKRALDEAQEVFGGTEWGAAERFAVQQSAVCERAEPRERGSPRKNTTLFGYGHYARTCVLPSVRQWADVRCIHEVDPALHDTSLGVVWDTSPRWRGGEAADVALIAGYHHTHAPLAAEAARRGCAAIVEKPVATTHQQLDALLEAARAHGAPVFAAFQKRYAQETEWLREDLALEGPSTPCDYACIVHEVALPERHWYRWPVSGSRVLSNGCHWLDHFLVLNPGSPVRHVGAHASSSGTIVAYAELDNGACFSMTLGARGSGRLGTRELVEVTRGGRTARLLDMRRYVAEDGRRVLRRASLDKHAPYANMYQSMGRALARGHLAPFDTIEALERSARAALVLDDCIRRELS
ncbi:MAG: Gfo/Idh/MocA family oxidoreductase, partial [Myxococcota bacterium]